MAKNIYITAVEPNSGKSAIALGVMEFLIRNLKKVAFFRPIISVPGELKQNDNTIHLISDYYHLEQPYEDMYAFTLDQAKSLMADGKHAVLLEGILDKYKALESANDFVMCLGTDYSDISSAFEFDLNAEIANNLGCPLLIVSNARDKGLEEIEGIVSFIREGKPV